VINSLNYIVLWDENPVKEAPGVEQVAEQATVAELQVAELQVADRLPQDDFLPQVYERINWQPLQVGPEGLRLPM
jgi:hypothetical protein